MADLDGKSGDRAGINHPSQQLARIAGRQGGVVARGQLIDLGFTDNQIRGRVDDGRLHRVHHNVFAVGHRHLSDRAHLFAALLTFGHGAFLSHRTAAAVWKLRVVNLHDIEVTLAGTGGRDRDGLTVHRARHAPSADEIRRHGDLWVSSVPRLLVELAVREEPAELARLVTVAVQKRLLRLDARDGRAALEAVLARHARRPGMARLKAVLAAYRRTGSSKSGLERAFDRLIAQHPEIPPPLTNIYLGPWEIDRYWPSYRLAVELDGRPYHIAVAAMEKDRVKDAWLLKRDITPLRFTDHRVAHEPRDVLADLCHFLGLG